MYDQTAAYLCAYCGSENIIEVDISGGLEQQYYEECQACSRSNRIHLTFDDKKYIVKVKAETEY